MYEVEEIDQVRNPKKSEKSFEPDFFSVYTWCVEVDDDNTTIYANFHGEDPRNGDVEINVRRFYFWPEKPGSSYITADKAVS